MVFGSLFRPKPGGKILVAFASQTGAAERIAWLSANALAASGSFVRVAALGSLEDILRNCPRLAGKTGGDSGLEPGGAALGQPLLASRHGIADQHGV